MAKTKTIILRTPVQDGKDNVTELVATRKLKYLRGHALRVTADGRGNGGMDVDFGTLIDLGAKMVGKPPSFLEELEEEDQSEVMQEARDFLLLHLGTGPQE